MTHSHEKTQKSIHTTGASPRAALTESDTALLLRYVNPAYLSEDAWASVAERFKEEGSVQLRGFLRKGLADKVLHLG